MGKLQHTDHGHEAATALAAQALETGVDSLDEEHVTLIEDAPRAPAPERPTRFDDTQRIWCPQPR